MANRYNRLDNSSPVQQELKSDKKVVPSSAHDLSHIHNGNAIFGALTPVCVIDTVPSQKVDINLSALLEFRNPTTRQLFNSARVYFHARYARLTDLWEGARNWLDNGRSGKLNLTRPNLIYTSTINYTFGDDDNYDLNINACTPMSLLNYLGLPAQAMHSNNNFPPLRSFQPAFDSVNNNTDSPIKDYNNISEAPSYFPADLCMMYQRDWRDFYANKNLLQNNQYWFPDNEEHFILSYSASDCVCIKYEDEDLGNDSKKIFSNLNGFGYVFDDLTDFKDLFCSKTPECNNPITSRSSSYDSPNYYPNLSGLKFVQLRGDRFTTASPFPDLLRGDMPILSLSESDLANVKVYDGNNPYSGNLYSVASNTVVGDTTNNGSLRFNNVDSEPLDVKVDLSSSFSSITMSDIYTLETLTAFRKKMGMTNGDYNEMIEAQFGFNPHVHDRHSTYIGGFYQDFAFSSVTQLSESATTPLGTKAGQGVSSGSGSCGQFTSPDFGWIIVYMFILPDVYYTQGKPRMFSKQSNLEMYFPLFNNLPAQGIRNDELYISGDDTIDSQPFAYEDRYAEFKSKQNRVSGFMGLTHSQAEYDSSRVIARRFESLPTFNNNFVHAVPENIDMDVFAVTDEPPIDFSIGFNIRSVFPGPYVALEGSLSSPALN